MSRKKIIVHPEPLPAMSRAEILMHNWNFVCKVTQWRRECQEANRGNSSAAEGEKRSQFKKRA
jgi:hypothetical protein